MTLRAAALIALSLAAFDARADDGAAASVRVLRGATVHTVANGTLSDAAVVLRGRKIEWVGPAAQAPIPDGAEVVDLAGKVIIPGLVDTHSHIGISPRPDAAAHSDSNEDSGPLQSKLRAIDSIWPDDPGIRMATAGGITTANIMPGSGNAVSGQTAYVKLRGKTVEDMLVDPKLVGGMKMANGENTKRHYASRHQAPSTRMALAGLQRELFVKAQEYQRKQQNWADPKKRGDKKEPPDRDLALEPVVEILEGKRTVHHHTHRSDDIMTILRLKREFGFEVVLHHCSECWRVADEIAKADVPVSFIMLDSPGGKFEASRYRPETAGELERAGVRISLHTDDSITSSRLFLRSGALAVGAGMSEEGALRALTLEGARQLHLEQRVGSLEKGKDADLVVLSGPPFSVYTQVLETWIEGQRVFDRADPVDRRYATGGFQVWDRHPSLGGKP